MGGSNIQKICALFLVLFLVSCTGATLVAEYPIEKKIVQQNRSASGGSSDAVDSVQKIFSLAQNTPRTFTIADERVSFELLGLVNDNGRARIKVNEQAYLLSVNQSVRSFNKSLTLFEIAPEGAIIPRKSWVDISISGIREQLFVGQTLQTKEVNLTIDFIGLDKSTPTASILVNNKRAFLAAKEEKYFDEAYVFMHEVYYNSAKEFQKVPAVTLTYK